MEGQERNTAQLERIGMGLGRENKKKENGDKEEESEDGSGESQEEGTLSLPPVRIVVLFLVFFSIIILFLI